MIIPGKNKYLTSKKVLSLFASLSQGTAWEHKLCSPVLCPRKASGRPAVQPVKHLVTLLTLGYIPVVPLAFPGQLPALVGWVDFLLQESSVLRSCYRKTEPLNNLPCSSPWSHSMEMWIWDPNDLENFSGMISPCTSWALTLWFS